MEPPKMDLDEPPKMDEPEFEELPDEGKVDAKALRESMDDFFGAQAEAPAQQPKEESFDDDTFPLPKDEPDMPPLEPLSKDSFSMEEYKPEEKQVFEEEPEEEPMEEPEEPKYQKPVVQAKSVVRPATRPIYERDIPRDMDIPPTVEKQMINNSMYVNVAVFRKAAQVINNLGEQTRVSEETLMRIKDITQNKDKVYEKWLHELEGLEKEMIHLDKMLFNM
jgi:hypothetical protein